MVTPPIQESVKMDAQTCSFGLKDGASPVGKFCPMDGKRLHDLRKGGEK